MKKVFLSILFVSLFANSTIFAVPGKRKNDPTSQECPTDPKKRKTDSDIKSKADEIKRGRKRKTQENQQSSQSQNSNNIIQIPVLKQDNHECGYHAFYNAAGLNSNENEIEIQGVLNNQENFTEFLSLAKQKITEKRNLDRDDIEKKKETAQSGVASDSVLDGDQMLSGGDIEFLQKDKEVKEFLKTTFNISDELIDDIEVMEFPDLSEISDFSIRQGLVNALEETVEKFKNDENKQSVAFVIKSNDHLFAVRLIKDGSGINLAKSFVADSFCNDISSNVHLNTIFKWFNHDESQSSNSQQAFQDGEQEGTRKKARIDNLFVEADGNEIIEKSFRKLINEYDYRYPNLKLKNLYLSKPGRAISGLAFILDKEKQSENLGQRVEIDLGKFKQACVIPENEYENYKWKILITYHDRTVDGLKTEFERDKNLIKDFFFKYLQDICLEEKQHEKEASFFEEYVKIRDHQMTNQEKNLAVKLLNHLLKKYIKNDSKKYLGLLQVTKRFLSKPDEFVCILKNTGKYETLINRLVSAQPNQNVDLENQVVFYDKKAYEKLLKGEKEFQDGTLLIGVDLRAINLNGVNLRHSILIGANFKGNRHLYNLSFQHSDLSYSIFDGVKGIMLFFNNSNLTNASFIRSYISTTNFNLATLVNNYFDNAWLYKCIFAGEKGINDFSFKNAKIQECRFGHIEFNQGSFVGIEVVLSLKSKIFYNCTFKKVDFTSAKLRGVYFENCFFATTLGWKDFGSAIIGEMIYDLLSIGLLTGDIMKGFGVQTVAKKAGFFIIKKIAIDAGEEAAKEAFEETLKLSAGMAGELLAHQAAKVVAKEVAKKTAKRLVWYFSGAMSWAFACYDGYVLWSNKDRAYNIINGYRNRCIGLKDLALTEDCLIYSDHASWSNPKSLWSDLWYDVSGLDSATKENLNNMGMRIISCKDNVQELFKNILLQAPYTVVSILATKVFGC